MRRLRILVMVLVAATFGNLVVGCTSSKPSVTPPSNPAPAPAGPQTFWVSVDATSASIPLAADEYFPNDFQVHPGATIKFNEVWSGEPHTVSLGSLADQRPTPTAPPASFPSPARVSEPIPAPAQPCFLDTGTPPATAACPKADQPAFSGGQAFYSSGRLPPTSSLAVPLSPTINPGTYAFRCLVHPNMTGKIHVVPPGQTIPGPVQVTTAGAAQLAAVVTALVPAAQDAALVTATNVAGITAGGGATTTPANTLPPARLDVA